MEARDFVPADLDLVVRLDIARMRSALGDDATDQLSDRALPSTGEDLLRDAIKHADAVWFGLRLMNLDPGDRVVAVEGHLKDVRPPDHGWQRSSSRMDGVQIFDREGDVPRDGTARLYVIGDRMLVFVSPVETDSVARMLEHGADKKRGDPPADGFVGLDLRTHRLPPPVERRFPSVAKLVADLERVRATVTLEENGLHVDAQISAGSSDGADRAQRFLLALRDNVPQKYAQVLADAKLDRVESTVHLRWVVPAAAMRAFIVASPSTAAAPSAQQPSP